MVPGPPNPPSPPPPTEVAEEADEDEAMSDDEQERWLASEKDPKQRKIIKHGCKQRKSEASSASSSKGGGEGATPL